MVLPLSEKGLKVASILLYLKLLVYLKSNFLAGTPM
jgi:hypothetical protein